MSQRITITLNEVLAEAVQLAVREGRSPTVSADLGEAIELRLKQDARLAALSGLIDDYEQLHGAISDEELAEQEQSDRDAASSLRSSQRRAG